MKKAEPYLSVFYLRFEFNLHSFLLAASLSSPSPQTPEVRQIQSKKDQIQEFSKHKDMDKQFNNRQHCFISQSKMRPLTLPWA